MLFVLIIHHFHGDLVFCKQLVPLSLSHASNMKRKVLMNLLDGGKEVSVVEWRPAWIGNGVVLKDMVAKQKLVVQTLLELG